MAPEGSRGYAASIAIFCRPHGRGGTATTRNSSPLYVTVLRRCPGQGRPAGRRGFAEQGDRPASGSTQADRQQVAETVRSRAVGRFGQSTATGKTGLQARKRIAPTQPPGPGRAGRVEFEYERHGVVAYMAAWDVHRAKIFGLCEPTTGIESYHRLVDLVMRQEPYASARRVFWVTDNGSSHNGERSRQRLAQWYPQAIQVHLPVHASWLNQIEIYFSIVSRKVLTPDDFSDVDRVKQKLMAFQAHYETIARPFEWKFTRSDLNNLLAKLAPYQARPAKAAG
jgi:hypothetical protein